MYFFYLIHSYNKTNIMNNRLCTKCKQTLPIEEFYFMQKKNMYNSWCKTCTKNNTKQYWKTEKGKAYLKKYREENRQMFRDAGKRYREKNIQKCNNWVYDWKDRNLDSYLAQQDKYQSKIPPSVYGITYKGEIVYIGKARKPLMRVNVHLSTITTGNNLTKINKLHSYLGYDKSDFNYVFLHQAPYDELLDYEHKFEKQYDAKGNYDRIFGKQEGITSIKKRLGYQK